MRTIKVTASLIRAMLCFVNPKQTCKLGSSALIKKLQDTVQNLDGSKTVEISFALKEEKLFFEFSLIAQQIFLAFSVVGIANLPLEN